MKPLRFLVIIYGLVFLLGSLYFLKSGSGNLFLAGYFLINAVVILTAAFFERGRYQNPNSLSRHESKPTGERFIDDSTGKLMEVWYNPQTGERSYLEVDKKLC